MGERSPSLGPGRAAHQSTRNWLLKTLRKSRTCVQSSLYLVKLVGEGGVGELQSYASACTLLESGLADTLVVHVDWRGSVVAINLIVRTEEGIYKGRNRDKFDTKVIIQNMENGPTPDTAAFIQKMEEEKARKLTGRPRTTSRSFPSTGCTLCPC